MNRTAAIAVRAPDSYEQKIKKHVLATKLEKRMLTYPKHITNYFILGSTWKHPSHVQGIVTPPRTVQTPDPKHQTTQEHFEEKSLKH